MQYPDRRLENEQKPPRHARVGEGLAVVALLTVAVVGLGYWMRRGTLPGDVGNPFPYVGLLLFPIIVGLLVYGSRTARRGLSSRVAGGLLLAACAVFLVCMFTLGLSLGMYATQAPFRKTSRNLHAIVRALEDYRDAMGQYPDRLDRLTRPRPDGREPFLPAIPRSVFRKHALPRYVSLDNGATTTGAWILWDTGPDGDFDAPPGEELRASLAWMVENRIRTRRQISTRNAAGTWIAARMYDPTNGTLSSGDMFVWTGGRVDQHFP